MPSVQSSSFNYAPFLEPAAFVSLALLAGFTRVIEYLPGASKCGTLLSTAMATTGSLLYTHTRLDPERSYTRTLLEKTAVLALANTSAMLLAKPLQGRLSLSAAGKLGCIQCVCTALTTTWNPIMAPSLTPLQKEHCYYKTHQKEWRALSIKDRTTLVEQFYKAGLSVNFLCNAPIDITTLDSIFTEYLAIGPLGTRAGREEQSTMSWEAFDQYLDTLWGGNA